MWGIVVKTEYRKSALKIENKFCQP